MKEDNNSTIILASTYYRFKKVEYLLSQVATIVNKTEKTSNI